MNENQEVNLGDALKWLLKNGVFWLGAIILYSRTADLLSAFAPRTFLGYAGIEDLYGMVSALMVEGTFFAGKYQIGKSRTQFEWGWNVLLIAVSFIISILAQPVDSFVVRQAVNTLPSSQQIMISWLVPMVPGIIVFLFLGEAVFSTAPAGTFGRRGGSNNSSKNTRSNNHGQNQRSDTQTHQEPRQPQKQDKRPQMALDPFLAKINLSREQAQSIVKNLKDENEGYQALRAHGIEQVSISRPDFKTLFYQLKNTNFQKAERDNHKVP